MIPPARSTFPSPFVFFDVRAAPPSRIGDTFKTTAESGAVQASCVSRRRGTMGDLQQPDRRSNGPIVLWDLCCSRRWLGAECHACLLRTGRR